MTTSISFYKKGFLVLALLLIAPLLLRAEETVPKIQAVSITDAYKPGVAFSVQTLNFGDFSKGSAKVTFSPNQVAQISAKADNSIQGIIPAGVDSKGGTLTVSLDAKTASFDFKIPYIKNVYIPQSATSEDSLVVSGENFDSLTCAVSIGGSPLKVKQCSQTQIQVAIDQNVVTGNLTVSSGGFVSAPYAFTSNIPVIDFVENKSGIRPGGTLRIHGNGFKAAGTAVQVFLDTAEIKFLTVNSDGTLVEAQLPDASFSGVIRVSRSGIKSNGIKIDSKKAPILLSYLEQGQSPNGATLSLSGKNFSATLGDNKVMVGKSQSSATYAEENAISASLPANITAGCLSVVVGGVLSNCLYYEPRNGPIISGITDPILENDGTYTVKISGSDFADPLNTSVFVRNAKETIKSILGSSTITVNMETLPSQGTLYVLSNGIQSNEWPFDFSEIGIPVITSLSAPEGLSPGRRIIISGANLAISGKKEYTSISIDNGGISTEDLKLTPYSLETYLDYNAVIYKETHLSVTVNGKKSNELTFSMDPAIKTVARGPSIKAIHYIEGITGGSKMTIDGSGFDLVAGNNFVHFADQQTVAIEFKTNRLTVQIPQGAVSGDLYVEVGGQKSNTLPYVAAPAQGDSLSFQFETLSEDTMDLGKATQQEVTVARLSIQNHLANLKVKKMVFDIAIKEDITQPNSFRKLGVLPFGVFTFKNSTKTGFDVTPSVTQCQQGVCQVTFRNFTIPPVAGKQVYQLTTTISPFVLNGSSITLSLSPQDVGSFEAKNVDLGDDRVIILSRLTKVTSPVFTFYNSGSQCFDSKDDSRNCNAFLSGKAVVIPVITPTPTPVVTTPIQTIPETTPVTPETPTEITPPTPVMITLHRTRKAIVPKVKTTKGPLVPFRDAAEVPWAQPYLSAMKSKGVTPTLDGNLFHPATPITRIDLLVYTLAALQIDTSTSNVGTLSFLDVQSTDPWASAVAWGRENGVIQGYPDGTFRPKSPVTRAEAVKIILTAGAFQVSSTVYPFVDLSDWQKKWVGEAYLRGIVRGVDPTHFEPNRSVTRAEAAKIILESLDKYMKEVATDQEFEFQVPAN